MLSQVEENEGKSQKIALDTHTQCITHTRIRKYVMVAPESNRVN